MELITQLRVRQVLIEFTFMEHARQPGIRDTDAQYVLLDPQDGTCHDGILLEGMLGLLRHLVEDLAVAHLHRLLELMVEGCSEFILHEVHDLDVVANLILLFLLHSPFLQLQIIQLLRLLHQLLHNGVITVILATLDIQC